LDDAGVRAVEAYLTAYGPATPAHLKYWLGEGLGARRKRIRGWIAALGERLVEVDVEGDAEYVLREDLEELVSTGASAAVRLLPAYDQWLLGPGTADAHIVPPDQRALVSRGANVVIVGGVVSGTWTLTNDELTTSWFARGQRPAPEAVTAEIARLASILDRHIEWSAR